MSKFDITNVMYMFLVLVFLMTTLSYVVFIIKNIKSNIYKQKIRITEIQIKSFTKKLTVKNYTSYEKYDIWRFCVFI